MSPDPFEDLRRSIDVVGQLDLALPSITGYFGHAHTIPGESGCPIIAASGW